jgi:2-oxoglutarate dehydrogenase E1 component
MKAKTERVTAGEGMDWGTCEALAFGTLLLEGSHVRITGQDVQRGTFSHRHCVVHDQATDTEYAFLNNLNLGPQEAFVARNSILSEYAVSGFELGYSYESPDALVIWEAQFGDFANTAQVIFDQFVSAGEHKWLQQTALTLLLPHGYDGQGAEHSSCRLERFLQMCDDDEDHVPTYDPITGSQEQVHKANWQVMNLTTPANYFHAIRNQLRREFRKPLVVASPKMLLKLKACVSSYEDMGPDSKFLRAIGERDQAIAGDPSQVKRLVFCSGKIYYELVAEREALGLKDVAIITVEMIAPFPFDIVSAEIKKYTNVDPGDGVKPGNIIWCQEEPKNMGPWSYVRPRMVCAARELNDMDLVVRFVGRRAAAAPATGIGKLHKAEQAAILRDALVGHDSAGGKTDRPSGLLGHQT